MFLLNLYGGCPVCEKEAANNKSVMESKSQFFMESRFLGYKCINTYPYLCRPLVKIGFK
jgi:hypothetical protein